MRAMEAEDASKLEYEGSGDGEDVVWFKQTIKNACGMFGILHGVCNGEARNLISMFLEEIKIKIKKKKKKKRKKGR